MSGHSCPHPQATERPQRDFLHAWRAPTPEGGVRSKLPSAAFLDRQSPFYLHRQHENLKFMANRQSAAQRGYGYRWQQARLHHLNEYPLCVMCTKEKRVTAATVVDHIKPHKGNDSLFWDRDNWQSLCKPHHDREKAIIERTGKAPLPRRVIGLDGYAIGQERWEV